MNYFQAIVLGIIQGASEFLPISSSGHLVIAPYLFRWTIDPAEAFIFDVLVQVATLAAVIIYFWSDLVAILKSFLQGVISGKPFQDPGARMGWYLVLATIPAGFGALLFKSALESAFSNPRAAALFLLGTSLLLLLGEVLGRRNRALGDISWLDALVIGLFQVLALFPGISRSGSTISAGLVRGLDRRSAARFSFLMAVPVMLAAGMLAGYDLARSPGLLERFPVYLAGFVSAGVVGYIAIKWFIGFLSKQSLYIFAVYCAVVGTAVLASTLI